MNARLRGVRLLVVGAAFLGGCSLLVPLDAVSGGADPDAGTTADASVDAANDTASATGDSGAQGGDADADAGPAKLVCPDGNLLCDDFERDTFVPSQWQINTGSFSISGKHVTSGTRGVTVAYSPSSDWAVAQHELTPYSGHIVLEFDVLFETALPAGNIEIAKLVFGPYLNWDGFSVTITQNGLGCGVARFDGSSSPAFADGTNVTDTSIFDGKFHHVVADADARPTTTKHLKVRVDNGAEVALDLPSTHTEDAPVITAFGTTYVNGAPAYAGIYFDDFVVTAPP